MPGRVARSRRLRPALLLAAAMAGVAAAWGAGQESPADDDKEGAPEDAGRSTQVERVEVEGRADDLLGIASSASEGATGRDELMRRPILRTGEQLETVPGHACALHRR